MSQLNDPKFIEEKYIEWNQKYKWTYPQFQDFLVTQMDKKFGMTICEKFDYLQGKRLKDLTTWEQSFVHRNCEILKRLKSYGEVGDFNVRQNLTANVLTKLEEIMERMGV